MKTQADQVRELVDEYLYLRKYCNIAIDDSVDFEHGQIELNMFLKWLGAKKPVGDKCGWNNIRKNCIGKRRIDPKVLKKKAKELAKTIKPEDLWK